MNDRYDELQPVLYRIQQTTTADSQQKLAEDNKHLLESLTLLQNQLATIHQLCLDKQQAWLEFKLRFQTTKETFQQSMDSYQTSGDDLEQLKVRLFCLSFSQQIVFLGNSK